MDTYPRFTCDTSRIKRLACLVFALLLSACGSGGDDSRSEAPTEQPLTEQPPTEQPPSTQSITLSVNQPQIQEIESAEVTLAFQLTLSEAVDYLVQLQFYTEDDTATSGSDYVHTEGSVIIEPGETSGIIHVTVNSDVEIEANEQLKLVLFDLNDDRVELKQSNSKGVIIDFSRSLLTDTGIDYCLDHTGATGSDCTQINGLDHDGNTGWDAQQDGDSDGTLGFRYTKLDASGNELPADATQWHCVKDNITQYMWLSKHIEDVSYLDAQSHVDSHNTSQLCIKSDDGLNPWRLPTFQELLSLVDFGGRRQYPDITYVNQQFFDPRYFITNDFAEMIKMFARNPEFFITQTRLNSEEFSSSGGGIRSLWLSSDAIYPAPGLTPVTASGSAFLVRTPQPEQDLDQRMSQGDSECFYDDIPLNTPDKDFEFNEDGTVFHHKTGLTWTSCPLGTDYLPNHGQCNDIAPNEYLPSEIYQAARDFNLNDAQWRVPNIKELYSITEDGCRIPSFNQRAFPFEAALEKAESGLMKGFHSATPTVYSASTYGHHVYRIRADGGLFSVSSETLGSKAFLLLVKKD